MLQITLSAGDPPLSEEVWSRSLYEIGAVLHEHGATRPTIVAALAERDTALGWNRYTDVPHEYGRIAAKVAPKPRLVGPIGFAGTPTTSFCPISDDDPCASIKHDTIRLRAQLDQVTAERDDQTKTIDTLRVRIQLADQRLATYQNPGLGSAKAVASGLIQILAAETPAKPDALAGYRVPLRDLSKITGLSEDACSRQVKQLAKYTLPDSETPVIHYNVANVGGLDRETGELIAPHKEMWLGPGVNVKEFAQVVSTLKPAEKPKWGGITNEGTCVDHPHDGVIQRVRYQKTVSYECSVCNHVLREETSPVASKRSSAKHMTRIPTPHDAAQQEETDLDFVPMPQDANSINAIPTVPVADTYVGKMRHRAEPQTRLLFPKPTDEEHAAGLAVWSQGMKPTPLDQPVTKCAATGDRQGTGRCGDEIGAEAKDQGEDDGKRDAVHGRSSVRRWGG